MTLLSKRTSLEWSGLNLSRDPPDDRIRGEFATLAEPWQAQWLVIDEGSLRGKPYLPRWAMARWAS